MNIRFFLIDAVQTKFGLTNDEIATVWTPMLDSIKPRRRNTKSKINIDMILIVVE